MSRNFSKAIQTGTCVTVSNSSTCTGPLGQDLLENIVHLLLWFPKVMTSAVTISHVISD